jgi:hypothetical protein
MNSKDLTIFASNLASSYALPLLDETNELICYRQPVSTTTCDPLSVAVTGTVVSDTDGLHPTLKQCYELLLAEWSYVKYWFETIFVDFTPPDEVTETEEYDLKTVLRLWILQFGGSVLTTEPDWQAIVSIFNDDSLVWGGLLAWSDGYLAGSTTHSFSAGLASSGPELSLFNRFSQVCSATGCSHKTHCQEVAPTSTCATS